MTTLNDYVALESDFKRLKAALEWIISVNQIERRVAVEVDASGNTYAVETVDGVFATEARRALDAVRIHR